MPGALSTSSPCLICKGLQSRVRPECMNTRPRTVPQVPKPGKGSLPVIAARSSGVAGVGDQGVSAQGEMLLHQKNHPRLGHTLPISITHRGSETPKHGLRPCNALFPKPTRPLCGSDVRGAIAPCLPGICPGVQAAAAWHHGRAAWAYLQGKQA